MGFFSILLLVVLGAALFAWMLYNSLVTLKMRVEEAWSGIDVQLKRRADLIPNLIEAVKGYAKHEKEVFEKVNKARQALLSAKTPMEADKAETGLAGTLKTLFAIAENYPDLKASSNFVQLQQELGDTEDKIAYARQFYNSNVLDYNTKIKLFPNAVIASLLNFKEVEFFGAKEEDRQEVEVKF